VDLSNASAVVIGGTGNFGSSTVRRLVAAGARTVIADINDERGKALAEELGESAVYVNTDVSSDESLIETFDAAGRLAPLRAVVIAYGQTVTGPGGRLLDRNNQPRPMEGFENLVRAYLNDNYRALRLAAAAMAKNEPLESNQRGVVVQTASIAGYEGMVGQTSYGSAKAGVIGLTLPAARDLAPVGVRVLTIAPGTFYTPAYGMSEQDATAKYGPDIQNPKRMGRGDEYAKLAMAMIDNDYLNGEVVRVDGALRFPATPPKA
jgi:NAD(P)-dependent dehydrogenase (short-subunit alcohol dehydrogenase family)